MTRTEEIETHRVATALSHLTQAFNWYRFAQSLSAERQLSLSRCVKLECRTCSRANYLSKGPISHKRGCATGAQYSTTAKTPAAQLDREIAESVRNQELRTFANNVRHTGLTKGRDKDMLDAVRKGSCRSMTP